jgi:hypothetical protein
MATSANAAAQSVPAGNKAGVIGTVKLVVGEVTATDQSGVQRILQEGDQVSANDVIQTSADGAVDIAFIDNTHVDLGRNSQIALDNSVFDPRQAATDQNDIAAIQAAIAAGADPTTLVPATAAGAGAADEGGSSFVVVDQNAARGNVTSGFETAGGFVAPPVPLANGEVTPGVAAAAIPPETPPETPPVTPPETPPEVPPETPPVTPPETPPEAPPETPPVTPPETPPETPPVTPPAASTPPVAANDVITTNEDTAVSGSVATNDTPGSAGGNVWTINVVATHGEVVFSPDGTYTYTPVANYNGPDSFGYSLTDTNGNVSSATVVVTVTPVNDAPVAVPDSYTTTEDTLLVGTTVLANDTDVEGNPLTAVVVTRAEHGDVVLGADGTFTYTPNANYNGPDSFTYQANDGTSDSNVATVSISVLPAAPPVNDPPVAVNDNFVAGQNQPLIGTSVLANDTDVEGNPLTAVVVTQAEHGDVVMAADGTFTYTPNANYNGPDSFTYQANDGTSDSNIATVTIDVNASPVGSKEQYFVMQSGTLSVPVANGILSNDTDIDSTTLTAVLLRNVDHGSLTLNPDGSFNYVPTPGYNGSDSYTYQPSDGITLGASVLVSLFIEPLPDGGIVPAVLSSFTDFNAGSAGGWVAHNTVTGAIGAAAINLESMYGGPSASNRVLEVASTSGINSLQQAFDTHKGTVYQVEVDFSTQVTAGAAGDNSTLQLLVNGTVIGVMPGGSSFAPAHHTFSFAGSGGSDLVEFRALDGKVDGPGGLIDNIRLKQTANAYQDHAALLQPFSSVFGDVTDVGASHVIRLSGMPSGSTVTDGTAGHAIVTTSNGQSIDIYDPGHASSDNWNLNTIAVTAPQNYVGPVQLIATESTTSGGAATATHSFALNYAATSFAGTAGVDIIHGSTANDIISGGPGDDLLSGSLGINTFAYHNGDLSAGAGGDHILDFKVGTATLAGDVLDISDLLSGHGISQSDFAGNAASYLQVISNAGVTAIQFDANGTAGASPLPLATLDGVGPGLTLNTLLDHGQIHAA